MPGRVSGVFPSAIFPSSVGGTRPRRGGSVVAPSAVSASPLAPSAPGQSSREPPSRPAPTVLVVALVVAAAALAAVGAVLLAHSTGDLDRAGLRAAMVDWIVVPYVLGGLIAWRRRPESRFGVLMIAAGLVHGRHHVPMERRTAWSPRSGSSSTCCRRSSSHTSSWPFPTAVSSAAPERLLVARRLRHGRRGIAARAGPGRIRCPQPAHAHLEPGGGGGCPERAAAGPRGREPPRRPAAQP